MKEEISQIKQNLETELKMANEALDFLDKSLKMPPTERKIISDVISSLMSRIKILNNSLPQLINELSLEEKKIPQSKPVSIETEKVYLPKTDSFVSINSADKRIFLEQLNINEKLLNQIRSKKKIKKEDSGLFKKTNFYAKTSNRFFLNFSENLLESNKFSKLSTDIKKSNLGILTATYISMMFLSTFLSIFAGVFLAILMSYAGITIFGFSEDTLTYNLIKNIPIIFLLPALVFFLFYVYPSSEKSSSSKQIDSELPFVVIHMGSISGSGIDPIAIFKIIGLSNEYKYSGKEFRKILNQINIYGYDLTTALRNVASSTPSQKLSELLNGIIVTVNSGGDVKTFFEKRAESLLLEYRLEREKSIKVAETFMDIYISVVIATPMILLLLLVMISVSGIGFGLGINEMSLLIIGIVAIVNVLFLIFLQLKQPNY